MSATITVVELDKKFVVFKRMKKRNWYDRGRTVTTRSARRASLFNTKEEAESRQKTLNVGRKAYKFRVETAAKHFVNSWRVGLDHYTNHLKIYNEYIAFNDVLDRKVHTNPSLNAQKPTLVLSIDNKMKSLETDLKRAEEDYKQRLVQLEQNLKDSKKRIADAIVGMMNARGYIETTDFDKDFIEKYQTDLDKKAIILFGKVEHVNTQKST